MAIEFYQWDGVLPSVGQASLLTGLTGALIAVDTPGRPGVDVGDVLVITDSTDIDGYYTCTEEITTDLKWRVVPVPTGSLDGRVRVLPGAAAKGGTDNISAFSASNIIQADTATFVADGVQPRDRVIVSGSGGTQSAGGNDGAWFVTDVISETRLRVGPLNGELGVVSGSGAGTVAIREGAIEINFVGETADQGFSTISSSAVPLTQLTGTSDFASGTIHDYVIKEADFHNNERTFWTLRGVSRLINTTSGFNFRSKNDIVVSRRESGTAIQFKVGNVSMYVGTDDGYDRYAASSGSVWVGINPTTEHGGSFISRGSYLDAKPSSGFNMPQFAGSKAWDLGSTILRPALISGLGTLDSFIESSIIDGSILQLQQTGPVDWKNLNMPNPRAANLAILGGSNTLVTVEGLLKGSYPGKLWSLFGIRFHLLNPRSDYHIFNDIISQLQFSGLTGTYSEAYKMYTWNPRFVERDFAGAIGPSPIQGLKVSLWQIDELGVFGEVFVGTYTTNASGRLTGIESDRDGINLIAQWLLYYGGHITVGYSYRIRIEGTDTVTGQAFKAVNELIEMRSAVEVDFPVDILQVDFEGEHYVG
jgi:hypothetical protein